MGRCQKSEKNKVFHMDPLPPTSSHLSRPWFGLQGVTVFAVSHATLELGALACLNWEAASPSPPLSSFRQLPRQG